MSLHTGGDDAFTYRRDDVFTMLLHAQDETMPLHTGCLYIQEEMMSLHTKLDDVFTYKRR